MKGKKSSQQGVVHKTFLEQYKQVYAMYNQATRLIKEDNLDSAELILQEIFKDHEEIQIPIEIYKTYILLLLTNKKEKLARQFLSNAPNEIKFAGEMLQIQQKYNLTLVEKTNKKKLIVSPKMIYSLIGGILICLVAIVFFKSNLFTKPNKVSSKETSLQKQIKDLEDKNKMMEMKVTEAEKKLTEKATDEKLDIVDKEQSKQENNSTTLKPINVVNQAVTAYEKGLEEFQANHYQEAIEEFKISYTLDSTNYSSDDALYYLILAELKANEKTNVNPYITEFINQTNEFFKSSPFYDDVLIMQAESLLKDHKNDEAEKILNGIVNEYSKEWTANKARTLLKGLKK
jgi:TolA-binding protein